MFSAKLNKVTVRNFNTLETYAATRVTPCEYRCSGNTCTNYCGVNGFGNTASMFTYEYGKGRDFFNDVMSSAINCEIS